MCARVEKVGAGAFDAQQLADGSFVEQLLSPDELRAKTALVAEGDDDLILYAGLIKRLGVALSGSHGFFAMDCFDALCVRRGFYPLAVPAGPGADADKVELFRV